MPIPSAGQSKEDFIKFFMSNLAMVREYPDEKQRLAVANSQSKLKAENNRDYAKEYKDFHGTEEQIKNRAKRNEARKEFEKDGKVKKGDGKEIDHIKPLSLGGSNDKENLQILSQTENREKGAQTLTATIGEGQGQGNDRQNIGGTDICICPKCKYELKHDRGTPCNEIKCPKCDTPMVGKSEESRIKITASFGNPTKDGKEWEVTLISEGAANTSTGLFVLPKEVMKASLDKFEGIDIYAHQFGLNRNGIPDFNHRPGSIEEPNNLIINKIGWVKNIRLDTSNALSRTMGTFHCINSSMRDMLINIWNTDKSKMPEFSIDADTIGDRVGDAIHIKAFKNVRSFDMVTKGAFEGAGFERLVATKKINIGGKHMDELLKQILANIKAGKMKLEGTEGKNDEEITTLIKASLELPKEEDTKLQDMIKAAITPNVLASIVAMTGIDEMKAALNKLIDGEKNKMKASENEEAKAEKEKTEKEAAEKEANLKASGEEKNTKKITELENTIKVQASANAIERILASETTLGEESKNRIRTMYAGKIVKEEDIKKQLTSEKEYLDRIIASRANKEADGRSYVIVGDTPLNKKKNALEAFINPKMADKEYNPENPDSYKMSASERFVDLKDAVLTFAGHAKFHEMGTEGIVSTMKAASTASFTTVFQDVMNKQIRKQYDFSMINDRLSKLIEEVNVETLDTQHVYDIGSFGLLSDVAESGTYQELSDPDDVEATYTLKKIGDIFKVTEEMFYTSGSKVTQLIRMFPRKMANSARATRNKFIADLITGCNGSTVNALNIYDGTPLYTSTHANITYSALNYTTFFAGYTAMSNQTVLNSGLPTEIEPRWLLVPTELKIDALNITENPQYPVDTNGAVIKNTYAGLGIQVISLPNYYLCSDINNWYLIGDKNKAPTLQMGFFQGKRTPQIYLQNQDVNGEVFTNDEWTWKIKFRFGGALTDYRSLYGGIVADA